MGGRIETEVERIVEDLLQDTPYELVDVEYVRERDWYLRIFVDKDGGIDLDDCQKISKRLDDILEEKNLFRDAYILEVSSPGLGRQLKKEKDLLREQGKAVDITLYKSISGKKELTGVLTGFSADTIMLDGQMEIPRSQIAKICLHIDF